VYSIFQVKEVVKVVQFGLTLRLARHGAISMHSGTVEECAQYGEKNNKKTERGRKQGEGK
jgi:hypothetical protein